MAQRDETSESMAGNVSTSSSITQNTPGAQRSGNGESNDLDAVKAEAGRQFDHVRHRAQADLESARHRASGFANEQKDYAATQLSGIAGAVRKVADELPQEQAAVGHYARDIADGLDQLSGAARDHTVGDIVHSAESFGRRQPAAFLGAAVLLGFAASRFVVASSHRRPGNGASAASRGDSGQPQQNRYGERLHG
jgi:hypothetical protein